MTVNTKTAERRSLSFSSLDDILADIEQFGDGMAITATGNWTPAQIVEHVSIVMGGAFEGPIIKAPWFIRAFMKLIRKKALNDPMKPGFQLPKKFQVIVPPPSVEWDDAVAHLRRYVERSRAGEQMTEDSPILGKMTNEDWVKMNCRHAEMHFSFIRPA